MSARKPREVFLAPILIQVGKEVAMLLEVIPIKDVRGEERYICVVSLKGCRPFSLVVKNMDELIMKLRAELAKFELASYGVDKSLFCAWLGM